MLKLTTKTNSKHNLQLPFCWVSWRRMWWLKCFDWHVGGMWSTQEGSRSARRALCLRCSLFACINFKVYPTRARSWNTKCFELMQSEGLSLDVISFIYILKACQNIGALPKDKQMHNRILSWRTLLKNDFMLGNSLVNMYSQVW